MSPFRPLLTTGLLLSIPLLSSVSQCGETPPPRCGSVNTLLGYDAPGYGGSWATLHRDGRNSDFADCELGTVYAQDWALRADSHLHAVKPVIGPNNRAWLAVDTLSSNSDDIPYLYGVDIDTGRIAVQLGSVAGLNGSIKFGQPLIDEAGNLYFSQDSLRPEGTPCRYEGEAEAGGALCGELWSLDPDGLLRWKIAIDGVSLSAQWTSDGKLLFQSWRGTSYVIEPGLEVTDDARILFARNHFPEAAATLPEEADGACALTGVGDTCIIANTPAVDPTTGAIYNTVQGFVAGRVDTFIQRWNYEPSTHAVEVDPLWDISAPLTGGSASSPVIHFDGEVLFVNDADKGVYALDAFTGKQLAKVMLGYTPGGSIIIAPELDANGGVMGAWLAFNAGDTSSGTNFVTLAHYRGGSVPSLEVTKVFDGSDGGVAWLTNGGSSAGLSDITLMSPDMRIGSLAQKSCGGCEGDGGLFLLIIDPKTSSIISEVEMPNVSLASLALGPDGSFITSNIGTDLMRRFVEVSGGR